MYHHISNIKTTLDRKVFRSFSRVTLHEHSTAAFSVKLINHEHKRNKTLVKPIDWTILPRTGHDVFEELENILTSEVENLRKYVIQMDDAYLLILARGQGSIRNYSPTNRLHMV